MSKTMAIINRNNIVENIVVCQDDEPQVRYKVDVLENDIPVIGGKYINGTFYLPNSDIVANKENLLLVPNPPKPKKK